MRVFERVLVVATSAALAVVFTEGALYSRNTFDNHPEWVNVKLLLPRGVMNEIRAFHTRNMLAGNRLNLDAWHGCNEVLLNRVFAPGRLQFRFRLGPGAELSVLFNHDERSFAGVSLGRAPRQRFQYFQAEAAGRFLRTETLQGLELADGWHSAAFQFGAAMTEVSVDGRSVARLPEPALARQTLGFRSGCSDQMQPPLTAVDDVRVWDAAGSEVIHDSFRNRRSHALVFFAFWLILAGGSLAAGRLLSRHAGREAAVRIIAVHLVAGLLAVIVLAFDFFYWSHLYNYSGFTPWGWDATPKLSVVERVRRGASYLLLAPFDSGPRPRAPYVPQQPLADFLRLEGLQIKAYGNLTVVRRGSSGEPIVDLVADDPQSVDGYVNARLDASAFTVVLLGTSQTWGAGGADERRMIASEALRALAQRDPGRHWVVVNAAIPGSFSTPIFERYRNRIVAFHPAVVVVNLSNNDQSTEVFADNLAALVTFNRSRTIRTSFFLEASQADLGAKHEAMRQVAARLGVPCLDLDAHMAGFESRGFLWWDLVHLTSYGQALAGDFIANGILDVANAGTPRVAPHARGAD
jgi:lysophospholipase L1-like esterase